MNDLQNLDDSKRISLFGGSMSMIIPRSLIDASEFRQVPDNQEVWISASSNDDSCMIVELVEYDSTHDTTWHFQQLAIDNEATNIQIIQKNFKPIFHIPNSFPKAITLYETLLGIQSIVKFRSTDQSKEIYIYLAVLNIPLYNTTILISYNQPDNITPELYNLFLHYVFSIELHDSSLFK